MQRSHSLGIFKILLSFFFLSKYDLLFSYFVGNNSVLDPFMSTIKQSDSPIASLKMLRLSDCNTSKINTFRRMHFERDPTVILADSWARIPLKDTRADSYFWITLSWVFYNLHRGNTKTLAPDFEKWLLAQIARLASCFFSLMLLHRIICYQAKC